MVSKDLDCPAAVCWSATAVGPAPYLPVVSKSSVPVHRLWDEEERLQTIAQSELFIRTRENVVLLNDRNNGAYDERPFLAYQAAARYPGYDRVTFDIWFLA